MLKGIAAPGGNGLASGFEERIVRPSVRLVAVVERHVLDTGLPEKPFVRFFDRLAGRGGLRRPGEHR